MSHITGKFLIDVQFRDTTSSSGVLSLKTLTIQGASEYEDNTVAIVSGTVGTATVSVSLASLGYRDAGGNAVTMSNVSRLAFDASGATLVKLAGVTGDSVCYSRANQPAVSEADEDTGFTVNVAATSGTASYSLILLGS